MSEGGADTPQKVDDAKASDIASVPHTEDTPASVSQKEDEPTHAPAPAPAPTKVDDTAALSDFFTKKDKFKSAAVKKPAAIPPPVAQVKKEAAVSQSKPQEAKPSPPSQAPAKVAGVQNLRALQEKEKEKGKEEQEEEKAPAEKKYFNWAESTPKPPPKAKSKNRKKENLAAAAAAAAGDPVFPTLQESLVPKKAVVEEEIVQKPLLPTVQLPAPAAVSNAFAGLEDEDEVETQLNKKKKRPKKPVGGGATTAPVVGNKENKSSVGGAQKAKK